MKEIDTLFIDIQKGSLDSVKRVLGNKNPDLVDNYKRTVLMNAALYGKNSIIEWLLECGANPNSQDKNGYTALHFSAQESHVETTKLLLQHDVNVNLQDINGNTASWVAIMYWNGGTNFETLKMLIDKGANLYLKNKAGNSAIKLIPQPIKEKLGIKRNYWKNLFNI